MFANADSPRSSGLTSRAVAILGVMVLALMWVTATPLPAKAVSWYAVQCRGFDACQAQGKGNGGYSGVINQSYWSMYAGHNCTNYVAYRLQSNGVARFTVAGQGNAYQWGQAARDKGIAVDKSNPKVGDVAWFDVAAVGGVGHVAYVESVNLSNNTIVVSEDNWGGDFDWRTYNISDVTGFIHVGGGSTGPIVQTAVVKAKTQRMSDATLTSTQNGWYEAGATVTLDCFRRGQSVQGYYSSYVPGGWSNLWYRASDGYFLADIDIYTGTNDPITPECAPNPVRANVDTGQWYRLSPRVSSLAVDVRGASATNGSAIQQYAANSSAAQMFRFIDNGDGTYRIVSALSGGPVLDVAGGGTANGTLVQVWSWTSVAQQKWIAYVSSQSGYVELRPAHAQGRCLDVPSGSTSQSVQLQIFDCNSTASQQFSLTALGSVGTTPIPPGNSAFTSAPAPTIQGAWTVGSKLTVSLGTWSPKPDSMAYQWYRDGVAIAGATGYQYTLQVADASHQLSVVATASKSGYKTTAKASARVSVPKQSFTTAPTPTVTGTLKPGYALTASIGTWAPTPSAYGLQWFRDGVKISGATSRTYTLKTADAGHQFSVMVTATRPGYVSGSKASARVAVPWLTYVSVPAPKVTGTFRAGYTLTAVAGAYSPKPDRFTYQWYRDGVAIPGAVYFEYTLTASDAGHQVNVVCTAIKSGYKSVAKATPRQLIAS